jgi:hypothetical protein
VVFMMSPRMQRLVAHEISCHRLDVQPSVAYPADEGLR